MEMSGEPELTEGTWLQLMCCAPSRSCCSKFQSNGVHGVYEGIPEYTGEDGGDYRFAQMGALWSIYELTTRRYFLMRRVKTNGEHNKKGSPEVNGVRSSTQSMI